MRIEIPKAVWATAGEAGREIDPAHTRPEWLGMRALLRGVAALFECDNAVWLQNQAFTVAIERLRAKRHGASLSAPDIDIELLHQDSNFKSGFVGVYPVKGGLWRATSRTVKRRKYNTVTIGDQFKSAIDAAWCRRQHYIKNSFPYGELELEIERELERFPQEDSWSDRKIIHELKEDFKHMPGLEKVFGPKTSTWEPELPPDKDGWEEIDDQIQEGAERLRREAIARLATEKPTAASSEIKMLGFENGIPPELEESLYAGIEETEQAKPKPRTRER